MIFSSLTERLAARISVGLFGLVAVLAGAQASTLPPAQQNGVNWLAAQVQSDGSLANETISIATPMQARAESLVTLALMAQAPTALSTSVGQNADANVEYAARRVLGASAVSVADSADVAALLSLQNPDGGWGLNPGYQSNAFDTALALRALRSAGAAASSQVSGALSYLAQAELADGGWGFSGNSSLYVTTNVLIASNVWSTQYSTAAISSAAQDWLLAQRDATQIYSTLLDNVLALRALATQTTDGTILQPISDAVSAAQEGDGSWAEDPYQTAVALNALWFLAQPPPPAPTGGLKGAVVDQSTGQPLSGATVGLIEDSAATVVSGTNGAFALSGLTPGSYTLHVTMQGYQDATAPIAIAAGQVLNVGTVALVPAPATANLSGIIKNSSGIRLANVAVVVGTRSTTTDANGVYQFTGLSPGSVKITASLSGYQPATATVNFVAGYSYTFSPTLYTTSETPPGTSVQGMVVDGATSGPISGAAVAFNGVTQTTDSSGHFLFANATVGSFTIQVSASGYLTVNATGSLAAGVNDLGKISMSLVPTTARLSGVVKNSVGTPLQNVVISVGSSNATTDSTGAYQITGLSPGTATITASLSGYQTSTATANFVAGTSYTFSPTLYSNSETPPGTSLRGVVVNATTSNPITGATVILNGVKQTTDATGKFVFSNIAVGNFSIQVSATGYFAVNGTGTVSAGINDLGTIALSPAPAATKYQSITSTGPLNKIFVGADLSTQVAHTGDTSYEVYEPSTIPADFGTFIVVGPNLYSADYDKHATATYDDGGIGTYIAFTQVSQTDVLGSGSSADPFTVTTIANVGTTGLTIKQTDSYVVGQEAFRTDVTVTNTTGAPVSAILYRALDCYLGNSDYGYGFVAGTAIGCTKQPNNTPPGRIEEFVPLTAGSNYYESYYASVWRAIGTHLPFSNHCDCATNEDNGMGLSWNITVPANGSLTYSNLTVFSPAGNQPLVVKKTADVAAIAPGDSDGYTITVTNANSSSLTLDSISDTLPAGFVYTASSSSGVTTDDPSIVDQTLTWNGPFTIPASSSVTLHFAVVAPTQPGTYYNQATANANTNIVVPTGPTAPVMIKAVGIGVVTDQPAYPANATALVTTTLTNLNAFSVNGTLTVNVYDSLGALVGGVVNQAVSIPASGNLPVSAPFAIGTIVPAQYTVVAVINHNGVDIAQAQTTFTVLPDNAAGTATSTVHTDKQTYNPSDQVQILSGVQSLSANLLLSNLTLNVQVVDAGNTQQFAQSISIPQLLAGQSLSFTTPQQLSNAAPGVYTVKQDLLDSQNALLSHVETTYAVSSTSDTGFGLAGTIAVSPKSLPVGATLTLNATATDLGNGPLNNLPLTITILDPNGAVMQQFSQTSSIAVGSTVPFNTTWQTQGTTNTLYTAVLTATVGNGTTIKTLTLAQDNFTLTAPANNLKVDLTLTAGMPTLAALVLMDPNTNPADVARVTAALAARNYAATFVSTPADFGASLRTGAYQLYLLLAGNVAPDAITQRLLREAVHRGEGLVIADGAGQLSDALAQLSGLQPGNLPVINAQAIDVLSNAPGGAAHVALNPPLSSRIVVPQSAQTQATLTGRLPAAPDQGTLTTELANLGRIDIGYFGNDAGTNGSHLSLISEGRIHNPDGSDASTVWLIRNSGSTSRIVTLASVAGGYTLTLTITPHTDTFIASPIVAGTADHTLSESNQTIQTVSAVTAVFADTRIVDVGSNPGAIALWANHVNASDVLDWNGSQHVLHGAVHSNSDIVLTGSQNLLDGPVHYVTTFSNSGSQNTFTYSPRAVSAQPLPILLNFADFQPGGAVSTAVGSQYFDETAECAVKGTWQRTSSQMPLAAGVYWIPCDVHISGTAPAGNVTLVGTGAMQIDGAKGNFTPFYQGVQFATSQLSATAIRLTGDGTRFGGLVFAPQGAVQVTGSSMTFACSIVADTIRLSGAKTQVDVRQCAYATVQEQTPAVVWNAFGSGSTIYAAFGWQGAIDQYEAAAPGELTSLFAGVLGEVAPSQIALRAGFVVPLAAAAQNQGDPFQGQLALSVDDDSIFVPSTASWQLDFTSQASFTANTNVRLGSGASTAITGTVSAATPVVVDPLKQTSTSISHLPGDSLTDLINAAGAISNPDAGISAALRDLQAAQAAIAANDANGALGYLLDAAESCGTSANSRADALRTRIDWVIWGVTH